MTETTLLDRLEDASQSPRLLALLRIDTLGNEEEGNVGTAEKLVNILQRTLDGSPTASELMSILDLIQNISIADVTLLEEVYFTDGLMKILNSIQNMAMEKKREDKDTSLWESLLDLLAKIQASMSEIEETLSRSKPFIRSELESRLPLTFTIPQEPDNLQIMVHQVSDEEETATHDTGFVMWPAALVLARHIAENPSLIWDQIGGTTNKSDESLDILELGAGCGLVGLTAATLLEQHREECKEDEDGLSKIDGSSVILTDYCPTVLQNISRNLDLNDLTNSCEVSGLDFFDQPGNDDSEYAGSQPNWIDIDGKKRPQVGLILAADVICYSNDAINVANTINAALVNGGKAMVMAAGDNRRFGLEQFPDACRDVGLKVSIKHLKADGKSAIEGKDTASGDLEQTSMQGYAAQDYNLTLYTMDKL